jgi:hypothetical protein
MIRKMENIKKINEQRKIEFDNHLFIPLLRRLELHFIFALLSAR